MDLLAIIVNTIYGFIFAPFAVCNLFYGAIQYFKRNQTLDSAIALADKILYTAGLVYFIIFLLNTLLILQIHNAYDIFGKYASSYWLQTSIWFLCSQAIRIPFIKRIGLFRILFSVILLISIQYYTSLGTNIARDYPDIEWTKLLKPTFIYFILFAKSFLFGLFCIAFVLRNKRRRQQIILDEDG